MPDWLAQRAATHSDHIALVCEGRSLTFADLARSAATYDSYLCSMLASHPGGNPVAAGSSEHPSVATLLPSCPELVALAHAVPRRGRILVPLGNRLEAAEIGPMLRRSGCSALLFDDSTRSLVDRLPAITGLQLIHVDEAGARPTVEPIRDEDRQASPLDLDSTHTIVFTSGTTGTSKGVRLTWGNHFFSAAASAFNLGISPTDRWLLCLPLHHVGGLSVLTRSVLYGTTVDLHRRFDPRAVNRAIDEYGVTIVSVVANMMRRMLDARGSVPYPSSLRAILIGGGPVPSSLAADCYERGVPILPTYGLTETASQIATAAPPPAAPAPTGSVGKPLLSVEVRVVDGHGEPVACGTAGEIQVRGPMVSPGTLGQGPRAAGSWLSTRDYGSLGSDGFLYVEGRFDDTVISGGENVHPGEIERVLDLHPRVIEAFAAGMPDPRWGEVVYAAVRGNGPVDEAELIAHCRTHLAQFKVPVRIVVVADFPRTASGKIARAETSAEIVEMILPGALDEPHGNTLDRPPREIAAKHKNDDS